MLTENDSHSNKKSRQHCQQSTVQGVLWLLLLFHVSLFTALNKILGNLQFKENGLKLSIYPSSWEDMVVV